jgi:hypothetical protein
MKQTNIFQTIILLLGMLLLTVGCNSDNDGIFRLISESEETVEVGTVTLIAHDGTTLIAHTSKDSLQAYDTSSKNWTKITPSDNPVLSSLVSTDGTNVYYSARSDAEENNTLYSFPIADPSTRATVNSDYDILSMAAQDDLMTIKNGTQVEVRRPSDDTSLLATYADHNTDVLLLSQSDDYYMLSGYEMVGDAKEYQNRLYNGGHEVTLNGVPTSEGIIAFYAYPAGLAVVATNGDVYFNSTFNLSADASGSVNLTKGENVPLAPTTKPLTALPVIQQTGDTFYYVQGNSGYMYKINPSNGEVAETTFSSISITVTVSSFYDTGTEYYIGTVGNGILEVTFP